MKQFYKNLIQGKRLALLMSVIVFCTIVILVFVVQHSENNEVYENSTRPEPILNEDVSPNKNIEKDSVKNIEKNVVHFCIDVNPGVEFTLDENGIVTDVRAANEDAEKLLLGLDLIGKSGDTATVELLNRLEEQNYITLSSLNLSYEFNPEVLKFLHVERLKLSLIGNDIFRVSTVKMERGITYPYARTFSLSAQLTF